VAVSAIEKAAPAAPTARREAGLPVAGELPPSGTDVAREMVDMVKHSRSFEANAVFFRNLHETLGLLTDLKA
jgi:flagellar basal body rod protein FlgC